MQELNYFLFQQLNGLSDNPIIASIAPIFADLPIFFLPLFLMGMWLYYTFFSHIAPSILNPFSFGGERGCKNAVSSSPPREKNCDEGVVRRIELMHIFYACVLGMIFSFIIKQFVDIERPEAYLESTANLLLGKIPEKSFPSDHATISFAFAVSLFYTRFYKIGYYFLPLIILMNMCRIVVGVHWPLDIFAGSLLGTVTAVIFFTKVESIKLVKKLDILIIKLMKTLHLY